MELKAKAENLKILLMWLVVEMDASLGAFSTFKSKKKEWADWRSGRALEQTHASPCLP